jgi:hypothetical protein
MGSRLLPLALALCATLADVAGAHRLGGWLVLAAIPCAAGAVVSAVGDQLAGQRALVRSVTTSGALVFLLVASAVRHGAPVGAAVQYLLPALLWVLQPAPLRAPQPEPAA